MDELLKQIDRLLAEEELAYRQRIARLVAERERIIHALADQEMFRSPIVVELPIYKVT